MDPGWFWSNVVQLRYWLSDENYNKNGVNIYERECLFWNICWRIGTESGGLDNVFPADFKFSSHNERIRITLLYVFRV